MANRAASERRRSSEITASRIQVEGTGVDVAMREHVRSRIQQKFADHADAIERTSVSIASATDRRGDVEMSCTIRVALPREASVMVEERGATPRQAFDLAATTAARMLRDTLSGETAIDEVAELTVEQAPELARPARRPNPPPEDGSYFGNRVGHGMDELERAVARPEKVRRDALVDTSRPGVSATDRKAGGGSTARRNTKRNLAGMTHALEDSAQERPSRKSTRGSTHRIKRDANLKVRHTQRISAPKERARRDIERGGKHVD